MNINLIAPINFTSYGLTSANILHQLTLLGHDIALFPIGRPECYIRFADSVRQALQNADKFEIHTPCIRLFHQFDLSMFVGHSTHIGFPIFELDTFTDKEKHHLQSCDQLFVCSEWAAKVCYNNFVTPNPPIAVVPLGVDTSIFTPKKSTRKPTIFLNVGKWEVRKGHDILVNIFNHAFKPEDNVELWMMCTNPFIDAAATKEWEQKYRNSRLYDKIRFIPRVETDEQLAAIMQQADCGVFPSRAEGWNLEALEMMACGKDVIITDYSAHTEFCTNANSLLVPINEVEPAFDGVWFFRQGNWAKLTTEHVQLFAKHMIQIHEEKQEYGLHPNEKGIVTANKFTWRNTAETIVNYLT